MSWSIRIARLFGIDIYVHFTFLLLLAGIAFAQYARTGNVAAALSEMLFVALIFATVVMHEYGHALTARAFGVATRDITLLPIGGVARLERIPENPYQELAIAVAGPAVNVVLAIACAAWLAATNRFSAPISADFMEGSLVWRMLKINVALVIFNMIPAFPMDGGRVLRAVLAMGMGYVRATQIAALALWLRCQRAYREMGLKQDRPKITKSNIVCAEPMPGEREMLDEFLKTLKQDRLETLIRRVMQVPEGTRVRATPSMVESLTELVRLVWDRMQLAGEAGSLLKIEEELQEAIRKGQEEWEEKQPLFRFTEFSLTDSPKETYVRYVPGEGVSFWQRAEALVLEALRDYARHAANGGRLQRQLFADDAERGFAFIDICQRRFDVVLMNPPFGEPATSTRQFMDEAYDSLKNEIMACFVGRGSHLLAAKGRLGAILSRTLLFNSFSEPLRRDTFNEKGGLVAVADLGYGVLDEALVETACIVTENRLGKSSDTVCFRLLRQREKEGSLRSLVEALGTGTPASELYIRHISEFLKIFRFPIA